MEKYFSNKLEIKNFRKKLRNKSTSAESVLWNLLKNKQIGCKKFRRQHSLGNYIVDFYCSSEKLIIELDGNPHGEYYKIEKDFERDEYLINLGYEVVRFENKLVFQDPEYIIRKIKEKFKSSTELPPP